MKKQFFRKYVAGALAAFLSVSLFAGIDQAKADAQLNVNADGAILVDGESGRVLYEKNADSLLGIASMTKMMTEYILLDAIKHGRIKWDQEFSVDDLVYKISQDRSLSNVPLRRDGKYKIRELYQAMAIYSANGATIAIAETIAGSEANFVKMMNDQASKLGLQDYKFVNSTGLNNSEYKGMQPAGADSKAENVMSTRATAKLAYRLIHDFPDVLKTASTPKLVFREGTTDRINMQNWNWMLPSLVYGYEGMDGLKTGTTDFAGYCFTGTAMRDGKRFLTVVQNAKDASGKGGYKARFEETRKMMDYAFSNFTKEEVLPNHYAIKGMTSVPVIKGKADSVKVYTSAPIDMIVLNGDKGNYKPVLVLDKNKLDKNGDLTAPVKKGDKIGYIKMVPKNGEKVSFLTNDGEQKVQADVVAAENVEKANGFVLMMRGIGGFFGDLWHGISSAVKHVL
ncbi:MAG: D-alanyl-D-alanine carboxypeptidase family protein [Bacillota bacterium]|nr:D-alanyl-D-alanine carboxypeptidase family protein [Bacillota bacterium]MDP4170116.1 D-alanyl-D-alanine carboxypeptidase family protein [Bacillota bacterium]